MISDSERHEVAERLRALPIDTYVAIKEWERDGLFIDAHLSDEADYSQIHNVLFGCFPSDYMNLGDYKELHERLADLIDRPTCHIVLKPSDSDFNDEPHYLCSRCGKEGIDVYERNDYTLAGILDHANYCSYCGARVVDADD